MIRQRMLRRITTEIENRRDSENPFWKSAVFLKNLTRRIIFRPSYFLKENRILVWKTNTKRIELEITTLCNLKCINCDRSARQAPSKGSMSVSQIEKFVNESIYLKWDWKCIRILGGEPTLHSNFFETLETLERYKRFNPNSNIQIVTNGFGKKVNEVLEKIPPWIKIDNTHKTSPINPFRSYNVAPVDLEDYKTADFNKACAITEVCGLGLTRYGYYICGAGAAVDRVFGFDVGIKKLALVDNHKLKKQRELLCKYCGHYKDANFRGGRNWIDAEKMSASWITAYENYKKERPKLTLY